MANSTVTRRSAPKLWVTNPDKRVKQVFTSYSVDAGFGNDDNEFELSLLQPVETSVNFGSKCLWFLEGTSYGGRVSVLESVAKSGTVSLTLQGLTWTGILNNKIVEPDSGEDYYSVSGNLYTVVSTLLTRCTLTTLFTVNSILSKYSLPATQLDRYCTLWKALRKIFAACNLTVSFHYDAENMLVIIDCEQRFTASNTRIGAQYTVDYTMTRDYMPVNHLIGMGKGELKDRVIVHYYADSKGNISTTQTLTGEDEITATYDYSNAEEADLREKTQKKLQEYLDASATASIDATNSVDLRVGDVVKTMDVTTGLSVSAQVSQITVKVKSSVFTVDYTLT